MMLAFLPCIVFENLTSLKIKTIKTFQTDERCSHCAVIGPFSANDPKMDRVKFWTRSNLGLFIPFLQKFIDIPGW